MKEIVNNVDVFLPNSNSEMERVASEFKLKHYKYIAVPNSIDKSLFTYNDQQKGNKYSQFNDCIVCAARIEGRKSTLNLVKAIKNTKYTLVLVGNASQNQKQYISQVHQEAGDNVVFLGSISHKELRDLYKVAKVHALVSWMETPGLSSLEAAAMGCNIVVTKKGDTQEYFEDLAYYCEPDDVNSIKKAIDLAYENPANPELKNKILSQYIWEKTAEKTIEAYQLALSQ